MYVDSPGLLNLEDPITAIPKLAPCGDVPVPDNVRPFGSDSARLDATDPHNARESSTQFAGSQDS